MITGPTNITRDPVLTKISPFPHWQLQRSHYGGSQRFRQGGSNGRKLIKSKLLGRVAESYLTLLTLALILRYRAPLCESVVFQGFPWRPTANSTPPNTIPIRRQIGFWQLGKQSVTGPWLITTGTVGGAGWTNP